MKNEMRRISRVVTIIVVMLLLASCDFLLNLAIQQAGGEVPNDPGASLFADGSPSSPTQLTLGVGFSGKIGSASSGGSTSYYSFVVATPGVHRIAISNCSGNASSLEIRYGLSSGSTPVNALISSAGTTSFQIRNATSVNMTYTVTVTWLSALPFEGSATDPVELTFNTPHAGLVGPGSSMDSYYKFTVPSDGYYDIVLGDWSPSYPSISLYLYNTAGFGSSAASTSSNTGMTNQSLTAGTHWLRLRDNTSTNESFSIIVRSYVAANEGSTTSPVELTLGTPHAGKAGTYSGSNYTSYYTFTVASSGDYEVTLSDWSPASPTVRLYLYNTPGFGSSTNTFTSNTGTSGMPLVAGTYYLRLVNRAYSDETFSITVKTFVPPNEGSTTSPAALTLDSPHAGRIGSVGGSYSTSYYTFTVASSGDYEIALSGWSPASPSVFLYLYDAPGFGSSIKSFSSNTGAPGMPLAAGTYYLRLVNNNASSDETFSITFRTFDPPREGTTTNPVVLTLGSSHAGKVGSSGSSYNYSYYIFTITGGGGTYDIVASDWSPSSPSVAWSLYQSSDFTGTSTSSSSSTGYAAVTLIAGTYTLSLRNNASSNATLGLLLRSHIVQNEGTTTAPIQLSMGVPYSAKVGSNGITAERSSYYCFDAPSAGAYDIIAGGYNPAGPSITFYLYTNAGFTGSYTSSYYLSGYFHLTLSAQRYYLLVTNSSSTQVFFTLQPAAHAASNDGSSTTPVSITIDTPCVTKVGNSLDSTCRYSYYTFQVATAGAFDVTTSAITPAGMSLYLQYGTSSTFSSFISGSSTGFLNLSLAAGTYYLRVRDDSQADTAFTLNVSTHVPLNEGGVAAPVQLDVGAPHSAKLGPSTDAVERNSYYTFTPATAGNHVISATGFSSTSHDVMYYLYSEAGFAGVYSSNDTDSGFTTGSLLVGTQYYLKVYNYSGAQLTFTLSVSHQ